MSCPTRLYSQAGKVKKFQPDENMELDVTDMRVKKLCVNTSHAVAAVAAIRQTGGKWTTASENGLAEGLLVFKVKDISKIEFRQRQQTAIWLTFTLTAQAGQPGRKEHLAIPNTPQAKAAALCCIKMMSQTLGWWRK
ncbi:hypothetical protein LTR36_000329 [Oleoguttula mirabilis]|uniref:Uncharacterized protein n=1 Tax=Oleoguttula mirabilis TaxID=1507867 RepID=A0AAV9JYF4_9PEZI|nr:hypothetical protein LTR36_000329 [Oleoguttula mirabilis]